MLVLDLLASRSFVSQSEKIFVVISLDLSRAKIEPRRLRRRFWHRAENVRACDGSRAETFELGSGLGKEEEKSVRRRKSARRQEKETTAKNRSRSEPFFFASFVWAPNGIRVTYRYQVTNMFVTRVCLFDGKVE